MPETRSVNVDRARLEAELTRIEHSGIFEHKPNQARLFRYLAARLLRGEDGPVKEYVLGVEALGRPPDFDPKTDSIVRVEIRKLRRTLEEYEKGPGRESPFRIRLPMGEYRLEVLPRDGVPSPQRAWRFPTRLILFAALVLVGAALALFVLRSWKRRDSLGSPAGQPAQLPALPPTAAVRILAGNLSEGFTDAAGRRWDTDRYYEGGIAIAQPEPQVLNVQDPRLFQHHRLGEFRYRIPVRPGLYELRLYFAELSFGPGSLAGGGEASRLFSIYVNGRLAYEPLDVIAEAPGRAVGMRKVFLNVEPAPDGRVHIEFKALRMDKPFVNAIELVPGLKDRMLPLRMVAAPQAAENAAGHFWEPDAFFIGGRLQPRNRTIEGAPSQWLFRSERFGHFSYHLHVVKGRRYRLTLWMAEQYFGFPGASAGGHRVFDVYANGVALLRNFDLMREARGPGRALQKSFSGLRPDAYGAIRLQFVPVRNYPLVNAIELVDEGPA